jgi:hypothetical protein
MSFAEVLAVVDVIDKGIEEEASETKKMKIKRSKPGEKNKKDKSKKPQEMPQQPQEKPNKPLMDLRHILRKHEKKVEPKPIQQVDFYGSMAAIPFLKTSKPEETKKRNKAPGKSSRSDERTKDKKVSIVAAPAADAIGASDEVTKKTEEERTGETRGERRTISYLGVDGKEKKVEITIIKDYDEEQLKLWKRMSADDAGDDFMMDDGPAQMLPLMPTARPQTEKKRQSNFEIGYNRPEEWLNPDLKTQDKMTYKVKDGVSEEPPLEFEEGERTCFSILVDSL